MDKKFLGYIYLALAMISVGSTIIASKIIAASLPPFMAAALRFLIAFPCFLVLMRISDTKWPSLGKRDLFLILLQAAAGSVGYTVLLITGMQFTSATDAGVITGMLPAVSALIAFLLLKERITWTLGSAILLSTLGALAINLHFGSDGINYSKSTLFGNALVFLAIVCEGLFILLNKRLSTPISPLALSTAMTGIGFCLSVIPALFEWHSGLEINSNALLGVAYYALVPTVCGFLLWYAGLEKVSGAEASLFTALVPVSAVIFAAILLKEKVGITQFIGIVCVLIAVLMAGLRGLKKQNLHSKK